MLSAGPADAQRRGGGGARGGGARSSGMRSGGSRSMSGPAPTRPSGGFNLSNDMASRPSTLPSGGNIAGSGLPGGGVPGGGLAQGGVNRPEGGLPNGGVNRPEGGTNRPDRPAGGTNRPDRGVNRPPVAPVYPPMPTWGWNGYVPWYPAPGYYGGGFWGPFVGGVATAAVFGEIVDSETQQKEESYQVQPDSPGAKVLVSYELTQAQCGPPDMVVIHGPNNSVVCANPNTRVAAGDYELDVTHLTISSKSAS
ncbi:MAG: hypothetical protein ACXWNZ_00950 [Vulcanimicrobiaceae bacterium]